ncbi:MULTISPECIES: hypothetical protein [unclassified Solwaraspora]|uniref:hypothetical protein n=1 Tax=unclassified Solwaraspora TaxID=2627926 RepID=UPI00259B6E11|nr:hypothetical protein [Solwaraspora sp. WMMA2056]WJK38908.1 hypothetical protein O7608_20705 [Solwaraspora sp. WMMA2056]
MRTRRRTLLSALVHSALLAGCAPYGQTADYPWYTDAEALYAAADLIVVGTPDGGERRDVTISSDGDTMAHQVFSVTVSQVFKGDAATGTTVLVKQTLDEARSADSGLVDGQPALLFLEVYDDVPTSLLNPDQGWYRIDPSGEPTPLPGNPVPVSLTQLARFADRP